MRKCASRCLTKHSALIRWKHWSAPRASFAGEWPRNCGICAWCQNYTWCSTPRSITACTSTKYYVKLKRNAVPTHRNWTTSECSNVRMFERCNVMIAPPVDVYFKKRIDYYCRGHTFAFD